MNPTNHVRAMHMIGWPISLPFHSYTVQTKINSIYICNTTEYKPQHRGQRMSSVGLRGDFARTCLFRLYIPLGLLTKYDLGSEHTLSTIPGTHGECGRFLNIT
jgi:hypothetical protein